MLRTYLKAENLKFKRSLFRKLIIFIPVALILISMVFIFIGIGLGGFSSSLVCNWCMPIASLSVMFLCHLVNSKDQKHKYRTLYSLPIDLKKTFISKTILIALNLLIISLLLWFITVISECILSGVSAAIGHTGYYILGYCLLWLSLLWQIPFCLFLDQKVGFVGSVIINLFASAFGGLFFSLTPLFWFFPYSWPARFMVTLFGVLPNGLLVEADLRWILNLGESSLLVLISLLAMLVLSALFSRWYGKQVYRK
ncbi:ABC-2 type transport system permease protein [Clostridium tetanomorphum]|uniref:lantibiotic immunity ABC transporter MutE/EpiE family permease subunit n=1 Tax=Clostridium tetanomorphum TaxID=1553 RepID=UPI0004495CC1|nr:lantibiotic immunity ABC transporter MutE/EpiE family permease subunit [Clostridium tetanomorphum]KAJ53184.1 permease [Clostridium tetanomorphum DSM 665]MBP1863582.1 ABC-2 type transport system permease protein [Clostridium tetanomorphum]NRS86158.1 ABC-2 type transport system permease protein [Clostridium tetanomorphum]SQC00836.1 permease [Clostridium tetanomorphum]